MANIKIRGHDVRIDIRAELEEFEWHRAKWTSNKLIAASPFRYDRSPSFFVLLEENGEYPAGSWGDSGAYDDEWKSGGIVKLLSFLRNETYEETQDYLILKSGEFSIDGDVRIVLPRFNLEPFKRNLQRDIIEIQQSPYLTNRGISLEVQIEAKVGKSSHYGFVAIPWYSPDGQLSNVKYRATKGKTFFYERNARPIRELVFGADLYNQSYDDLIICEAEIDALSWRVAGYNAVAIGGVSFTKQQVDIIRRLPFKRLVVAGDNDKAGFRFNEQIVQALKGRDLAVIQWRNCPFKDANDLLLAKGDNALHALADSANIINHLHVQLFGQ
ncbi:toprim domain-containing protein [Lysinibacillus xylanilyticus]|uniref:Toprim domain-containing protein n=1 Tax=Lysinibacillus xylanilyticus TaxID=582475 RepID=A0ABT4EMC3_9BACI|nr:toprim domain-containing protein [Lysinibacillus xylanilyticus]MCY9546820.1 toprim domain-containing protein [Lysinibacillus xylanilyticus]